MTPSLQAILQAQKRELVSRWRASGAREDIVAAYERISREDFVPRSLRAHACADTPLPIPCGQRLSQPSTMLFMVILLDPQPGQTVLEVGAGTGFLCAWLAEIGCTAVGVEVVPELAVDANQRLQRLGYGDRVRIFAGDGSSGWEAESPYDRIVVSGGIPEVPRHMAWQLTDGGRIVAPVGVTETRMVVLEKRGEELIEQQHGVFLFSPLIGRKGVERNPSLP